MEPPRALYSVDGRGQEDVPPQPHKVQEEHSKVSGDEREVDEVCYRPELPAHEQRGPDVVADHGKGFAERRYPLRARADRRSEREQEHEPGITFTERRGRRMGIGGREEQRREEGRGVQEIT